MVRHIFSVIAIVGIMIGLYCAKDWYMGMLSEYKEKRDFRKTPEPDNNVTSHDTPIFVIQKHDATTLHYDFRLEIDGVLKSWAVPKGPSTNPSVKRLAIPTEDHPLGYADFEGVIPEDEYGGGTVIVWDTGTYKNVKEDDDGNRIPMQQAYENGEITVVLYGEKLRGAYALIRTPRDGKEQWLLIKTDDEEADARRNPTSTEPQSVISGKTIEEVEQEGRE